MERLATAVARDHATEVVRDVESPGGPSDCRKRPGREETVNAQDGQIQVLDPLVEEDFTQFQHLELASDGDFEGGVGSVAGIDVDGVLVSIVAVTVQSRGTLGLLKILQPLKQCINTTLRGLTELKVFGSRK